VDPIRQLAGQTAVYGLSSIIGRLLNYLLVPLYTHVFLTSEFGVITEMYSYVAFLLILLTYGMETAFFRFAQGAPEIRQQVFSTSLISVFSTSSLFILIVLLFQQPLAELLQYPQHTEYIVWLGIIVGLDALNAIPFARLRSENKALLFASIKLIGIGISIGLVLFFLLLCPWLLSHGPESLHPAIMRVYDPDMGVGYVFVANLVATAFTTLLLLPVMLRDRLVFASGLWRQMLIYALPLLIAGFAGVINEALDKLLLKYMLPADIAMSHVGIYGASYKLSIMMTIFIQAFRFAAEPFFFARSVEANARELYARVMKFFVVACLFIFLGIMLYMNIVQHFVGPAFREGLGVVPILLLANMFLGIYFNLSIWYKLNGQTRYGAWFAIAGALVTILLNIWWIPLFGYHGSAWATLACYMGMTLLSYGYGQKHYKIPYDVQKILLFIGSAVLIFLLSTFTRELPSVWMYLIHTLLLGLFAVTVVLIDPGVGVIVRQMIRRRG
jgi:O-antigen/teichoic acid export membrane protein